MYTKEHIESVVNSLKEKYYTDRWNFDQLCKGKKIIYYESKDIVTPGTGIKTYTGESAIFNYQFLWKGLRHYILAHEIGHLELQHPESGACEEEREREAHYFAQQMMGLPRFIEFYSRYMMPLEILLRGGYASWQAMFGLEAAMIHVMLSQKPVYPKDEPVNLEKFIAGLKEKNKN